jgi:hypothetical protein
MSKRLRSDSDASYKPEKKVRRESMYKESELSDELWNPMKTIRYTEIMDNKSDTSKFWISGTDPKNYLLRDPILDWFDEYYELLGFNEDCDNNELTKTNRDLIRKSDIDKERETFSALLNNGKIFEDAVNQKIIEKFPYEHVIVAKNGRSDYDDEHFKMTMNEMIKGTPIILQGVVFNEKNYTKGMPDLIVRSDYLNKLVRRPVIGDDEINIKAPNLSGNYHYRIIDIKWTGMTLCANGYTIRNEKRFPAYKGQLAIYNVAIGEMQGYIPPKSYIMAKSYKIDCASNKREGYNIFDLMGEIDYTDFDKKYIDATADAIDWIRKVRFEGHKWSPETPKIKEMYPNMSNTYDAPWTKIKQNLAKRNGEITNVWYVGPAQRNCALEKGITKVSDIRLTTESMNMNPDKKSIVINKILDINRQTDRFVLPEKIENNLYYWQKESPVDFYVDFETLTDYLKKLDPIDICLADSRLNSDIIFMIGMGYKLDGKWNYECFKMDSYSLEEEYKVINNFVNRFKQLCKQFNPDKDKYTPRIFHWTGAEVTVFKSANLRHKNKWRTFEYNFEWVDLYNIFISEPIVVFGSFNFKLKSVANAFYHNGLIETKWDSTGPSNGLTAMASGVKYYQKIDNNNITEEDKNIFEMIIRYNEVDCKVMMEIVDYLRANHC